MNNTVVRNDIENVINEYSGLLYRTCFLMLRSKQDVEDVMQETFIKYMTAPCEFLSEAHKKSWLLKVSQNKCKNLLRFHKIHSYVQLEELEDFLPANEHVEKMEVEDFFDISNLNYKYKSVVMLYYIEGYSVGETANILGISNSAVKMRLKRAREILRMSIEEIDQKEVNCNGI